MYCDIVGCDAEAVAVDDADNLYCESCMLQAIDEEDLEFTDFACIR